MGITSCQIAPVECLEMDAGCSPFMPFLAYSHKPAPQVLVSGARFGLGPGPAACHSTLHFPDGRMIAWGAGTRGRLGYNSTASVGDAPPSSIISAGYVPLGSTAIQATNGSEHTCALLNSGAVRCWGYGTYGRLGYNATVDVGDSPASSIMNAGNVPLP